MSSTANDGSPPKMSVCVMTYNHAGFIAQCLESVLAQQTSFPFEVIVGDDASTDGTAEIVSDFERRFPDRLRVIRQATNTGDGSRNYYAIHAAARGEYIAHLDGDDYCLPGKLQAQADILDADPRCNIVFHRVLALHADGRLTEGGLWDIPGLASRRFDRAALIGLMSIGVHSSKVYRRTVRDFLVPDFGIVDYFLHVEQVRDGVARFAGERPLGVYRLGVGISSRGDATTRSLARCIGYFATKYPEHRRAANLAALTLLLPALANRRPVWRELLALWRRSFHIAAPLDFWRERAIIRQLRLDSGIPARDPAAV